jgi:phenylalanyl-tRNA synthetase beta chain
MLVSYRWICEIANICPTPKDLSNRLTFCGLEVEGLEQVGVGFDNIVVGKITKKTRHPQKDKLSIVEVSDGSNSFQVVCGAPNCPGSEGLVVFAKLGAEVGGVTIETRDLGGVVSHGMLCSEEELGIGIETAGIMLLNSDENVSPGTPIAEALDLEDWILDIGITPNRPDALSHRGIARDAALLFGKSFEPKKTSLPPEQGESISDLATVELVDAVGCPRYGAIVISGIKVGSSPFPVRYRLHNLGIRPISNIVDVTNLIVLEYGQPLHAFDLDRLKDSKIIVRRAGQGEPMKTLDEEDRVFSEEDLLICDGEGPVAVAGVMGGIGTGVTTETKRVLIECAYFSPSGIRRTSKRLKLSSESSYRFERGIDPNMGPQVLEATAKLTIDLAGGAKAPGSIDCYPIPIESRQITMRPARFASIMGYSIDTNEIRHSLKGLGMGVKGDDKTLEIVVPTFRPDIEREIDLIEEVARIQGLDKVRSSLPRICCQVPKRPEFEATRRAVELLASLGLDQAINYSFVPAELLAILHADKSVVNIANPLNAQRQTMRTTLVAGLLESLKRAQSRFLSGICQFEVGHTFHDSGDVLPEEVLRAAALLSGTSDQEIGEAPRQFDYFDAKGIIERFVWEYGGIEVVLEPTNEIPLLHPRKASRIVVDGEFRGYVGEIHPEILGAMKLGQVACVFEIDLMPIWMERVRPVVKPLPEYPSMVRDVALLVDDDQDTGPVVEALNIACGSLAVGVRLFDVYKGKGIPAGKKSVAFSVTYRASDRTLTEKEVDKLHKKAVEKVSGRFDAIQR